ncbi:MAG: heme exporter protein CcmD [Pseudomonadota bacterium]
MGDFLDMGGYGVFVWPAYALAVMVLALLLLSRLGRLKRREAELERLEGKRSSTRREEVRREGAPREESGRGPAMADRRRAGGEERA